MITLKESSDKRFLILLGIRKSIAPYSHWLCLSEKICPRSSTLNDHCFGLYRCTFAIPDVLCMRKTHSTENAAGYVSNMLPLCFPALLHGSFPWEKWHPRVTKQSPETSVVCPWRSGGEARHARSSSKSSYRVMHKSPQAKYNFAYMIDALA